MHYLVEFHGVDGADDILDKLNHLAGVAPDGKLEPVFGRLHCIHQTYIDMITENYNYNKTTTVPVLIITE